MPNPEDFGAVQIGASPNGSVRPEDFGAVPATTLQSARVPSWSQIPGQALSKFPASGAVVLGDIKQTVMHPLQTAGTLADIAAGGLRNALPAGVSNFIDKISGSDPATIERITNTANQAGGVYKNRYGSIDALKTTLANDPVGALADLSIIFTGAGAIAPAGGAANAIKMAATLTNPATPLIAAAKGAANLTGWAGKTTLGLTTGVGSESIANAAKAGAAGDSSFWQNMTGKVPMTDVLDQAKQGLQNMRAAKSADYRSGMVDISKDKSILSFQAIDNALKDSSDIGMFRGQIKNPKAAAVIQEMSDAVSEWKKLDPATYHTPEGLDALKQKLGGILESIPYNESTARLAAGRIYSGAKSTISSQAPTYSKVMSNYAEATDLVKEIERTLSLNPKASVDTAIRKLQSLTRNNVNTNYGSRIDLANKLQTQGGVNLMPALAGQAMSSWTPRGLAGFATLPEAGAVLLGHPELLAALPFQSPRAMGALMYGGGRLSGALSQYAPTAGQARIAALLAAQAGNQ